MYRIIFYLALVWIAYPSDGRKENEVKNTIPSDESKIAEDEPLIVAESRVEIEIKMLTQLVERVQSQLEKIDGHIDQISHHDDDTSSEVSHEVLPDPIPKQDTLKESENVLRSLNVEKKVQKKKLAKDAADSDGRNIVVRCLNWRWIPRSYVCDGGDDCGDNSDEEYCCYGPGSGKFRCPNGPRICITRNYLCDGDNDCGDFTDESICRTPYTRGPWTQTPWRSTTPHGHHTTTTPPSTKARGTTPWRRWTTRQPTTSHRHHISTTPSPTKVVPIKPHDVTYKFNTTRTTWVKAEEECRKWNGHLATISNAGVNMYLANEMKKRNMNDAWIGFNDRAQEGVWKWVGSGKRSNFKNWYLGGNSGNTQPDGGRRENCGAMVARFQHPQAYGKWADGDCSWRNRFICQKTTSKKKEVYPVLPGKTNRTAAESCNWLNERFYNLRNGMYWIKNEKERKITYCDMEGNKVIHFPNAVYGEQNGTKYYIEGHVEILHDRQWGTVCGKDWDRDTGNRNANVLCKMGGYKRGVYDAGKYKQSTATKSDRIWLRYLYCQGSESTVDDCFYMWQGGNYCNHSEDVGIRCYI